MFDYWILRRVFWPRNWKLYCNIILCFYRDEFNQCDCQCESDKSCNKPWGIGFIYNCRKNYLFDCNSTCVSQYGWKLFGQQSCALKRGKDNKVIFGYCPDYFNGYFNLEICDINEIR